MNQAAFVLTNLPPLTNGAHYCLISVIQTPTHPVTIPQTFASNAEMVQWVMNNPAVGWRNISVVPNPKTQLIVTHGFSSINAAYWAFECDGRGFEAGSGVTIQCTDARSPFESSGTFPAPDPEGNQKLMFEQYIPANVLDSAVVATVTAVNQNFAKGAVLRVRAYQVPDPSIDLDQVVARPVKVSPLYARADETGFSTLIPLGVCTTILGD